MGLRLDRLDGKKGFRLLGIDRGDQSGYSVAGAGDVNGDGVDDLIIGSPSAGRGYESDAGESYVVFGSTSGFQGSLDLSALNGANGFRLRGTDDYGGMGRSVAGAGDVNGDGIDDLIIGAPNSDFQTGKSYVVFGSEARFDPSLDLGVLDGENGFRIVGIDEDDYSGISVAGVGDVNSDGVDDLIIGAPNADRGFESNAGESYVVFGSTSGFRASFDLADLDGENGFRLRGEDYYDASGRSVAGAGDVNGDGIDDLIIGAPRNGFGDSGRGESYVVFGSDAGFDRSLDLAALDGENGFRLRGRERGDYSGNSVAGAGDVNGDGIDDLIIGAPDADPYSTGESYVVFGSDAGFDPSLDLADLDGANGFRLRGVGPIYLTGNSVAGAGDFNGDGIGDLIIGTLQADMGGAESYLVFGSAAGFPASLDLAAIDGADGLRLEGYPQGQIRGNSAVAGAGDVNDDGLDDLIVGAPGASPGGDAGAGASYVVFGFRPAIKGGPEADELAGTEFDDRMSGRAGDDALDGREGHDRLKGGWGDDRIDGSAGRDRINGGRDDDRLNGGGGADVFVFKSAFGSDQLRDFDADPAGGQDSIDLRALDVTAARFDDAVTITDLGEDTEVVVEGHGTILCEDVSGAGENALGRSDFLLLA